ncbi:MAG: hypothetical protein Q8912_08625 [Bacillota bacterium]|nr:hypothetical protein [Bacillota bacterium]
MLEFLNPHFPFAFEINLWNLSRATAIVAYLYLWIATITGLLSKTKILLTVGLNSNLLTIHRKSACFSLNFIIFHALILSYDDYIKLKVKDLFIPFLSTYQTFNVTMGILAFYGIVLMIGSMFFLGGKIFRFWHLLTYAAYFMALWHGINIGTDSSEGWMQIIYWTTGSLVILVSTYRVILRVKDFHRSIEI